LSRSNDSIEIAREFLPGKPSEKNNKKEGKPVAG